MKERERGEARRIRSILRGKEDLEYVSAAYFRTAVGKYLLSAVKRCVTVGAPVDYSNVRAELKSMRQLNKCECYLDVVFEPEDTDTVREVVKAWILEHPREHFTVAMIEDALGKGAGVHVSRMHLDKEPGLPLRREEGRDRKFYYWYDPNQDYVEDPVSYRPSAAFNKVKEYIRLGHLVSRKNSKFTTLSIAKALRVELATVQAYLSNLYNRTDQFGLVRWKEGRTYQYKWTGEKRQAETETAPEAETETAPEAETAPSLCPELANELWELLLKEGASSNFSNIATGLMDFLNTHAVPRTPTCEDCGWWQRFTAMDGKIGRCNAPKAISASRRLMGSSEDASSCVLFYVEARGAGGSAAGAGGVREEGE